jgi:hypothetical protein
MKKKDIDINAGTGNSPQRPNIYYDKEKKRKSDSAYTAKVILFQRSSSRPNVHCHTKKNKKIKGDTSAGTNKVNTSYFDIILT